MFSKQSISGKLEMTGAMTEKPYIEDSRVVRLRLYSGNKFSNMYIVSHDSSDRGGLHTLHLQATLVSSMYWLRTKKPLYGLH